MCKITKKIKTIKNTKLNKALNSKYWQDYKLTLPCLSQDLFSAALGMALGDAGLHWDGRQAHIKFEQGKKQKDFLFA